MTQKLVNGKTKFIAPPMNEVIDKKVKEDIKRDTTGGKKSISLKTR